MSNEGGLPILPVFAIPDEAERVITLLAFPAARAFQFLWWPILHPICVQWESFGVIFPILNLFIVFVVLENLFG